MDKHGQMGKVEGEEDEIAMGEVEAEDIAANIASSNILKISFLFITEILKYFLSSS